MERYVDVRNLEKVFKSRKLIKKTASDFRAVDNVSFQIPKDSIFGLVGESGCGKTTLSRALLFLDPPTSGNIIIDGTDISLLNRSSLRRFRHKIQIVFQDPNSALNPKLTIEQSLSEGLENKRYPRDERNGRIDDLLNLVGITPEHKARYPHEFSGGQKQRIVIARALTMEPDFLILDEPVSNLDVSIQAQIINLLLDLKEKLQLTYLFISHDLNLVSYLSDKIAVMYMGRIIEQGRTDEVLNSPVHPYTKKLFSSAPSISGKIEDTGDDFHMDDTSWSGGLPSDCRYFVDDEKEHDLIIHSISDTHHISCFRHKGGE